MNEVISRLLTAVFPKRCELCGNVIPPDKNRCEECETLKMLDGKICSKCGREVDKCVCGIDKFSPSYKAFCAPFYFEDGPRRGVYRLKNNSFKELAPAMAKCMAEAVRFRFDKVSFDCVTCVPLRPYRKRVRGYNQSELIARALAKELGVPFEELVYKNRRTRSQRKSSAEQRRANLYGAFSLKDGADVSGKTVLVADDVKTTGATLSEVAFVLKDAGATVYATAFTLTNKR